MLYIRCILFLRKYIGYCHNPYTGFDSTFTFGFWDTVYGAFYLRRMILEGIQNWSIKQPNHAIVRTIINLRPKYDVVPFVSDFHKFMVKEIKKDRSIQKHRKELYDGRLQSLRSSRTYPPT